MSDFLLLASLFLIAGVIAVPITTRLGLGSMLGYLLAGIAISPLLALLAVDVVSIQHFAEFGVVLLMFIVGLELEPRMLWQQRSRLLGLGGLQVGVSILLIAAIAMALGQPWNVSLVIGMVLALSSTAMVLPTLNEKGLIKTDGGQASLNVLLFQDVAVIPMLAILPLLAMPELLDVAPDGDDLAGLSLAAGMAPWQQLLVALGAIAFVVIGGGYLARPIFRAVAKTRLPELFVAVALLVVIGVSSLMVLVDLSPALGTLLAGVLLANSEYRHELESDIEPFKGLLLGLFFVTVGASINFALLAENFGSIVAMTLGLVTLKAAVLYGLARAFNVKGKDGWLVALGLAQAGEFGFVLLSFSIANGVLPIQIAEQLLLVVALSMLLTPVLFVIFRNHDAGGRKLRVFISYSRSEAESAKRLKDRLEGQWMSVAIDSSDLPFGEEWQEFLRYLITRSDVIVFLVSPDSIGSKWCQWELDQVRAHQKRLVPVVIDEVAIENLPANISDLQLLPASGVFDVADREQIRQLEDTLTRDEGWIKEYTRLSEHAGRWSDRERGTDWLLRGEELEAAVSWLNAKPEGQVVAPSVLDLIHASRLGR